MPPSKKKRSQASWGAPAGGGQLLDAAREGNAPAVARLLAAGADPNASVTERLLDGGEVIQFTALGMAAGHGRLEAAQLLLDAGAEPSLAGGDGFTPLMTAAEAGYSEMVRLLLDAGADPSLVGGDGGTPLVQAAVNGQPEVLRLLLARGSAVDAVDPLDGWTAFHSACFHNQPECVEALAQAGCDVGIKNGQGKTGRELAEGQGHAAVVERLRAVVAEQLRATQAAGPALAPEPAAVVGDGGPADQLLAAAGKGDGAAVAR
jgi:ankyrin repeat protein